MSILVTGGAGFIGSHTCVELLNAGYDTIILDNLCNSKSESVKRIKEITGKDVKFVKCDIRDRAGLDKIFSENKIDAVIHFAGLKSVPQSCKEPLEYHLRLWREGYLLLQVCLLRRTCLCRVKRIQLLF